MMITMSCTGCNEHAACIYMSDVPIVKAGRGLQQPEQTPSNDICLHIGCIVTVLRCIQNCAAYRACCYHAAVSPATVGIF